MTTNSFPFKVLFWFEDDSKIIAEIKRTDIQSAAADKSLIYKWLHIDKSSGQISQLTFQSLDQIDGEQIRTFDEGTLIWNADKVSFNVGAMTRTESEQLPIESLELISQFLI